MGRSSKTNELEASVRAQKDKDGTSLGSLLDARLEHEPREKLLGRYLFSCDDNLDLAVETLIKDLRWRRTAKVDSLLEKHPREILGCEPRAVLGNFLCKMQGKDRDGKPVLYYSAKTLDAKAVLSLTSLDRYMMYQAWWRELLIRYAMQEDSGAEAPYYTIVMDLQGVRLTQASSQFYAIVKRLSTLDQWHFPGLFGRMFIVNSPFFFTMVWKGICKFLSAEVERKIVNVGSNKSKIQQALAEYISEEHIPADYLGFGPSLDWDDMEAMFISRFELSKRNDNDRGESSGDPSVVHKEKSINVEPGEVQSMALSSEKGLEERQFEVMTEDDILMRAGSLPMGFHPMKSTTSGSSLGLELDPSSQLPPHIAILVCDKSDPPRPGLRSEILLAIESVSAERDSFERQALNERKRLRWKIRQLMAYRNNSHKQGGELSHPQSVQNERSDRTENMHILSDPTNVEIVKNGLRARMAALKEQINSSKEECNGYALSVKFARNYLEQEAAKREQKKADLQNLVARLRRENALLRSSVGSSVGEETVLAVNHKTRLAFSVQENA